MKHRFQLALAAFACRLFARLGATSVRIDFQVYPQTRRTMRNV